MEFSLKKAALKQAALGVLFGFAALPATAGAEDQVPAGPAESLIHFNYVLQICGSNGEKLTAQVQVGTTRDNYINELREMDNVRPRLSGARAERYFETMPEAERTRYDMALRQRMAHALIGDTDAYFNFLGSIEEAGAQQDGQDAVLSLLQEKLDELSAAFAQAEDWNKITALILPTAPEAAGNLCLQGPQVTLQPLQP